MHVSSVDLSDPNLLKTFRSFSIYGVNVDFCLKYINKKIVDRRVGRNTIPCVMVNVSLIDLTLRIENICRFTCIPFSK